MAAAHEWSAREMLSALEAKRISARELLEAHLARHEAVHGRLNAVIATDIERAKAEAQAIDDRRARGEALGALAGLPMTIKDCYDVDGMPAIVGHPAWATRAKTCADAALAARVRNAGAIVWGKTNTPLLAGDFQSYNPVFGTTHNPYDLARTPGGSSGGAAAALAACVTPLEIGSDIGGSLRHPANFCGVTALKPTYGQLPLRGHAPPPPGAYVETDLSVGGPMARNIRDLRLLYDVLRGETSRVGDIKGARIALWIEEPEFPLAREVRAAIENAALALQRQGAKVEPVASPVNAAELMETYLSILAPIISAGFPEPLYTALAAKRSANAEARANGASRYSHAGYGYFLTPSYREVAAAMVARQRLKDELAHFFRDWDAILAPITFVPAFPHNQHGAMTERMLECDGAAVEYMHALDWIALATALHAPAIAVPAGRTASGLPIGAQLIGPWNEEARLLDYAAALERETGGFHAPPL